MEWHHKFNMDNYLIIKIVWNLWWLQLSNWFKWVNVNLFFYFQIHTTIVSFKTYWLKNGFENQSKYQNGFSHRICMFLLCKVHFDIYINVFQDQNLVNVFYNVYLFMLVWTKRCNCTNTLWNKVNIYNFAHELFGL